MTLFRITPRSLALTAAVVVVHLAGSSGRAAATTLTLIAPSQKVCQLTGEYDWTTGNLTAAQTWTNGGLTGVDLGFPVDSGPGGPLYFLFGDAFPGTTLNPLTPDDAIGYTNRTAPPDSQTCLDLKLMRQGNAFAHPTVTPDILQGSFNVPSGGVFLDDTFWAFFWTNHCLAVPLVPMPSTPLQLPTWSTQSCPQSPQLNILGGSVLAFADGPMSATFKQVPALPPGPGSGRITELHRDLSVPSGFVYVTAGPAEPHVPIPPRPFVGQTTYVPVFGVARYRMSIPYLAMAPHETFFDPTTWLFFAGWNGHEPKFITRAEWESDHDPMTGQWTPPTGAELYSNVPAGSLNDHCVGEHSVTYNKALHAWLLLYGCGAQIQARTAPAPWGPWSLPTKLISGTDTGVGCTLLMNQGGCGVEQPSSWKSPVPVGFFYAPFAMERFTQDVTPPDAGGTRTAEIFWLVSTWNPYQVIVMQSTLTLGSD